MAYSKSYGRKSTKKAKTGGAGSVKLHYSKNKHISKPKIRGYKSGRKTP